MNLFDRSGPCAPIHMVIPLLGSAVALLSLISVFGVVAAGVHQVDSRSCGHGHLETRAALHQIRDGASFQSEHIFAIERKPIRHNASSEIWS